MKTEKLCSMHNDGVGEILPASSFYVVTNRQGKPALAGYCKECSNRIAISYHRVHRDKANAAVRASRAKHPETDKKWIPYRIELTRQDRKRNPAKWVSRDRKCDLKKKYGVDQAWYEVKLAEQGGTCALCPRTISMSGRSLHCDHCHVSEQLRGILCDRCNNCLERVEKPGWIEKAIAYLAFYRDHPNKIYTPKRPVLQSPAISDSVLSK